MTVTKFQLHIRLPVEAMRYLEFQANTEGDSLTAFATRLLADTLLEMAGERKQAARDKMMARVKPETSTIIMELFERGFTAQQIAAKLGVPYRYVMVEIGAGIDALVIRKAQLRPREKARANRDVMPAAQPGAGA